MEKRKITWAEIYKEYRKTYPTLAKKSVHYEPKGFLEIVIFLDDGSKITYDYFKKRAEILTERWKNDV